MPPFRKHINSHIATDNPEDVTITKIVPNRYSYSYIYSKELERRLAQNTLKVTPPKCTSTLLKELGNTIIEH